MRGRRVAMELAAVLAVLGVVLGLPTAGGRRPAARSAAVEPVSRVAPGRAGDALVARPRAQAPGHDGVAPRTAHAGRGESGRWVAPAPRCARAPAPSPPVTTAWLRGRRTPVGEIAVVRRRRFRPRCARPSPP